MASICDFVSKFDSKLKNMKFSASLRLCGGKVTFFQTSQELKSELIFAICIMYSISFCAI